MMWLRFPEELIDSGAVPGPSKGCQIDDVWDVYKPPGGSPKFQLACLNIAYLIVGIIGMFSSLAFFKIFFHPFMRVAVPVGQVQMLPSKLGADQRTAPRPPWLPRLRRAMQNRPHDRCRRLRPSRKCHGWPLSLGEDEESNSSNLGKGTYAIDVHHCQSYDLHAIIMMFWDKAIP